MSVLFSEYQLVAASSLFDAEFYLKSNPDIAALNIDPVLHYVESGCRDRRDPSARFDTARYLQWCKQSGEAPANPLAHYLTVGIAKGFKLDPAAEAKKVPAPTHKPGDSLLFVDVPRITAGAAESPLRGGLSIVGWAIAAQGLVAVEIALNGIRVTNARTGLRRPDVAAAHPTLAGSLLSGYAAHVPPKALPPGRHQVTISMHERNGAVGRFEFAVMVEDHSDERGPAALRRKMSPAEVTFKSDVLERLQWRPTFEILLAIDPSPSGIEAARRSLDSLARQTYEDWEVTLIRADNVSGKRAPAARRPALPAELLRGFEDIAHRLQVFPHAHARAAAQATRRPARKRSSGADRPRFVSRLVAGDEFGCDALLEFALAGAFDQDAEVWYADEGQINPGTGKVEVYFKPGWSPDLLLATDYVGRAWCAKATLLPKAGVGAAERVEGSNYDVVLRLTETAQRIGHVPKFVYLQSSRVKVSAAGQREALQQALQRRQIAARIKPGKLAGHYRIQRRVRPARVSVIIPTCAAGGLVKTCIDSLRSITAYRDYEIVCIENIPAADTRSTAWLKRHADLVLNSVEPFNWSRFNNLAAARASGEHLLFLNDDVEIIESGWLEALLEQVQRPEVGVVGALLVYPDRSVQQAGVILDHDGRGRHAFRHLPEGDPGYFGLAASIRNVVSVTGACLMTRRETFAALGRFDESHAVINNDLDYCLKSWKAGMLNVYTPHARLIHHELGSRAHVAEDYDADKFKKRWASTIARGDPYFNANLGRDQEQFGVEPEPVEAVYCGGPLATRAAVRRILVVKLDHLGDCLTALPALRRLKQHFPGARISVLAGRASRPIWTAVPAVDEVIDFDFFNARSGLGKVDVTAAAKAALEKSLRAQRFDLAVDLRKQPDTREVLRMSGARHLAGFDHQGRFPWLDMALEWDEDVPLRTKHGHVSDDLIALIDALSAKFEPPRDVVLRQPKTALRMPKREAARLFSKPLICIHAASGSSMRQWPLAKFFELVELLLELERFHIALLGGPDEIEFLRPLTALTSARAQVFNLVGQLTLDELPSVLARAALFVGNNSGPQHLAAALGVPTIGIHSGVVDASEWGPVGRHALALRRAMACSPCFLERPEDCHRGVACLTELPVGDVYRASLRSLGIAAMRAPETHA